MSMNAMFVQVDEAELSRIQADPSLAETLFASEPLMPPVFTALAKAMQDRVRAAGPQLMADALSRLDPALRRQIEESMGRTNSALASGGGGPTPFCRSTRPGTACTTFCAVRSNRERSC